MELNKLALLAPKTHHKSFDDGITVFSTVFLWEVSKALIHGSCDALYDVLYKLLIMSTQ